MKDCPYKWPEKSFIEKDIFSMEKIVGSTLELSAKVFFSLDKYQLKIWVENTGFAIQYIGNNKSFTKVPPPPLTNLFLLLQLQFYISHII